MTMSTKVAVISSRAFKERLTKLAQQMTDIELDFYIYKHPAQTPNLKASSRAMCFLLRAHCHTFIVNQCWRIGQSLGPI